MNILSILDGKKSKIAAALAVFVALNQFLLTLGLPHLTEQQMQALLELAGGLGVWGIAHKLELLRDDGTRDRRKEDAKETA